MKATIGRLFLATVTAVLISACVSSETQIKLALQQNPKLVFDVIEQNPEQFIDVVNKAARLAQQKQSEQQVAQLKEDQERDWKEPKKPLVESSRILEGTAAAPITIVEYADFQCPYCKMGHKSLEAFKEKYKGRIQFVFKNMPLDGHQMAYPAATYFEALRNQGGDKALKFYNLLFKNQGELSEAYLKKTAQEVGANMAQLAVDLKSPAIKEVISKDMAEFQNFGFTGTPTIILNGVALVGAQPIAELERVLALTTKKN